MEYQLFCTGSSGLVASAFKAEAQKQGMPFYGIDLHGEGESVNILDSKNLTLYIQKKLQPGVTPVLFHFAALTFTGTNLTQEQIDLSWKINVDGTQSVLDVCRELRVPMVHISTDFVFAGGNKKEPYLPNDPVFPDATVYSQTKARAEEVVVSAKNEVQVVVVRIAFPYGNMAHPKPCLLKKMLGWMDQKPEVALYNDQHTCPTPVSYISSACCKINELVGNGRLTSGSVLHVVGQPTTPYEFGSLIKQIYGKTSMILPSSISGNGAINLVLDTTDTEVILGMKAPSHEEALEKIKLEVNSDK